MPHFATTLDLRGRPCPRRLTAYFTAIHAAELLPGFWLIGSQRTAQAIAKSLEPLLDGGQTADVIELRDPGWGPLLVAWHGTKKS